MVNFKDKGKKKFGEMNDVDKINMSEIKKTQKFVQELEIMEFLEEAIERSYLQNIGEFTDFDMNQLKSMRVTWLRILRLPVHPSNSEIFDLTTYWQNVLSTFNVWGNKFIFLLLRFKGETRIFIGVSSSSRKITTKSAIKQIRQATSASIPGIDLQALNDEESMESITDKLLEFTSLGSITGMPSFKQSRITDHVQTLDALAFGFKGETNEFTDYATLIISEPVSEKEINGIIKTLREYGNEIHSLVKSNKSNSYSEGKSKSVSLGLGILDLIPAVPGKSFAGTGATSSKTKNYSKSVNREILNKTAEYVEQSINMYIERLKKGEI